ncbi:MAG: DNA mismatch repair protein MutS, partial [Proteobacteria bacterium]|nr:DNA mismatch repair protein MutS [Pseudomonadota bacterium]
MAVADSPVMQQYQRIKAAHAGALVMFRMGDFYELFGDDALVASEILQITLTRRRTAKEGDAGVPMCGVPFHAAEGYIGKLLAKQHKVALVEQVETPEEAKKARGSNALVRRDVVRVFTPATLTEESFLEGKQAVLLAAVCGEVGALKVWSGALAWLDVSTGEVGVRAVAEEALGAVLAGLPVGEVLVAEGVPEPLLAQLPR